MKQAKRRLLSLLMAMALVCSLLPTAFADDFSATISGLSSNVRAGDTAQPTVTLTGTAAASSATYIWTVSPATGSPSDGCIINNANTASPTISFIKQGAYTINVAVSAAVGGTTMNCSATPVTVTVTGTTATATLTVSAGGVAGTSFNVPAGGLQLTASVHDSNGQVISSYYTYKWELVSAVGTVIVNNPDIAAPTFSPAANQTGSTTYRVTATPSSGYAVPAPVTVTLTAASTTPAVTSISASTLNLNPSGSTTGYYGQLTAGVSNIDSTNYTGYFIRWTSSNTNVRLTGSSSLTSWSTAYVDTNLTATGNTASPVYVVANSASGTATVTGTLYAYSTGSAVTGASARSCTVTVGSSGYSVSLSCSPNSNTSVPLNYYYDYPDYWYDRDPYYYGYRDITVTPVIYQNGAAIYNGSSGATGSTTSSGSGSLRVSISYAWTLGSTPLNSYNSSSTWNSYYTNSSSGNSSTARIYARDVYNYYSTSSRNLTCTVTVTLYNGAGGVVWSNSSSRASASWTVYSSTYYNFEVSATVYQGENYYLNTTNTDTRTSVLDQINNYIQSNSGRSLSSVSFSSTSSNGSSLSASSGYTYSYGSTTTGTLSGIYFTPTSAAISSTSQASFRFTATDSAGASYSGTLIVNVKPGTTVGGSFSMTGTAGQNVTLKLSDFTNWWKNMYPSGSLSYVDFTSVSAGSLHTSSGGSVTVSANSATHCYATASGTRTLIEGLIYTPTTSTSASTVTIKFTGHGTGTSGGNAATYARTGTLTINLNAPAIVQNLSVAYSCTSSTGVSFRPSDFYNSNATAMAACSYVTFGTPSSGSLYAANSPVAAGTQFSLGSSQGMTSVSGVTYRPASGYNGTVTIPFYAYNSAGTQIGSGTVSISVSQPVQQEKPTVPTTPKKTFSDVTANNWYYTDVTTLVNAGIVDGRSDGKFHPNDNVTYGEALKLILVAAGYPKQTEGTGSNWAMPYYRLALEEGLTPSNGSALGLNEAIDRNTIAEIACKALDLTPVTDASSSPFTDSDNPYVLALNAVNIIRGTSGTTFEGENTLKRSEICAIVCRIYSYNSSGQQPDSSGGDNTTPSGDTSGDNTVAPGWV